MKPYYYAGDLLAGHKNYHGTSIDIFHKMVFVQQITALEAYLGDTLINAVIKDTSHFPRSIFLSMYGFSGTMIVKTLSNIGSIASVCLIGEVDCTD